MNSHPPSNSLFTLSQTGVAPRLPKNPAKANLANPSISGGAIAHHPTSASRTHSVEGPNALNAPSMKMSGSSGVSANERLLPTSAFMGLNGGLPLHQDGQDLGRSNRYLPSGSMPGSGTANSINRWPTRSGGQVSMSASDRPQVSGENRDSKSNESRPAAAPQHAQEGFRVTSDEINTLYMYAALGIITLIRTAAYWQSKSIGYFFGFRGQGYQLGNPDFEISKAYPMMEKYYGLLVGLCFTLPYSIGGLFSGQLTRQGNKKAKLLTVIWLMSLCQCAAGSLDSFGIYAAIRIATGVISSAVNPLAYALVADFFPGDQRTTANSILSVGNYIGIALSSLSIILIKNVGWRAAYITMGAMGLMMGCFLVPFKNPARHATEAQETEDKKKNKPEGSGSFLQAMRKVVKHPVCSNIFAAGFARAVYNSAALAFIPVLFQRLYPAFKSQYALINAAALVGCGFSSSLLGGVISDKFEKKSYMTKSLVIILGNTIGIPIFAGLCFASNFYVAMTCFALCLFFQSCYLAPAITMMQNSTEPEEAGLVVSAYTFFSYLAQTLSPAFFGYLANVLGAAANPRIYGYLVLASMCVGLLGGNVFYWRAGKEYSKIMTEKDKEAAALAQEGTLAPA